MFTAIVDLVKWFGATKSSANVDVLKDMFMLRESKEDYSIFIYDENESIIQTVLIAASEWSDFVSVCAYYSNYLCWVITSHVVLKYRQYVLSFRHKACVWQTDGRTYMYGQNYDPKSRASIAASRCKTYMESMQLALLVTFYVVFAWFSTYTIK